MPRHIQTFQRRHRRHGEFVAQLVPEFTANGPAPQPLILEERLPDIPSRRLQIIWDAWRDLSYEQRSEVILDAYRQVEGAEAADEVTIATGATAEEALGLGLLPYGVVPSPRTNGKHSPDAYAQAEEQEAAHTVLGHRRNGLRYARLEDAE